MKRGLTYLEAIDYVGVNRRTFDEQWRPQPIAIAHDVPVYASPLRWIKLAQYCALSGDTTDAVHARRRKRQWIDGQHCRVGPDGNLWVNPDEVNKWVESEPSSSVRAA